MSVDIKDWVWLITLAVTLGTFYKRLNTDTRLARYRETIGFIEKREKDKRERWKLICGHMDTAFKVPDEEALVFFGHLELVAVMMKMEAFDEEIVYQYWWRYFYDPLNLPLTKKWIEDRRRADPAVLENFIAVAQKWRTRIEQEMAMAETKATLESA